MKRMQLTLTVDVDEQAFQYVNECGPREMHKFLEAFVRDAVSDTLTVQQHDIDVISVATVWP